MGGREDKLLPDYFIRGNLKVVNTFRPTPLKINSATTVWPVFVTRGAIITNLVQHNTPGISSHSGIGRSSYSCALA